MKTVSRIALSAGILLTILFFSMVVGAGTHADFDPKDHHRAMKKHASVPANFSVFGPNDYARVAKHQGTEKEHFSVLDPGASYTLHVYNGGKNGQFEEKVSSAVIRLNGRSIVTPREFERHVSHIERPIRLLSSNRLSVEIHGKPDSGMTIEILGVDHRPPAIAAEVTPSPNVAGWNNTDVTVTFICSDTTSGIAFCPQPVVVQQEEAYQVVAGTATDIAGNKASTSVVVNLDKTPPVVTVLSPLPGANLQDSPAKVQGTVDEALSGVASITCNGTPAAPSNGPFVCDVALVEGDNTIAAVAADLAGNTGQASITVAFLQPALELAYVDDMQLVWQDAGSGGTWDGKYARPVPPEGFYSLGSFGQTDYGPISGFLYAAKELAEGALASPVDYTWVYSDWESGADMDGSFWKPVPPAGYVCLGLVAQTGYEKPGTDAVRCVRQDLTVPAKAGNTIWIDHDTGATYYFGSWQIVPADEHGIFLGTFTGSGSSNDSAWSPPTEPIYTIDARRVKRYEPGTAAIEELVGLFGPTLHFYLQPPNLFEEHYYLDDPDYALNSGGMALEWGLVQNESSYGSFSFTPLGSLITSSAGLMQDVASYVESSPQFGDPSFRAYLRIDDSLKPGSLDRAKALVRVRPWNHLAIELQFWFFYPFNGPGRAEVCASGNWCDIQYFEDLGRHYGDWEHVTLRVDNRTQTLISVYMSRHAGGQWIVKNRFADGLEFDGTRPRIYAGLHSHAHYPKAGAYDYLRAWEKDYVVGTASVDLRDLTNANGQVFFSSLPDKHRIISSALPGFQVAEPEWLQFPGRWGQYERLADDFHIPDTPIPVYTYTEVGSGPTGPAMKSSWSRGDSGENWWWTRNLEGNELCFDCIDNDGDGETDCHDPDCWTADPVCMLRGWYVCHVGLPFGPTPPCPPLPCTQ
jgi:hypothetical protein